MPVPRLLTAALAAAAGCAIVAATVVWTSPGPVRAATPDPTTRAAVVHAERIREASGVREQVVTGHIGPAPAAGAVTFAYAGDSITARPDSWLHVLSADPHFDAVGGYAHSGYRSDQVLADVHRTSAADVLVIELGTNDINQAKPFNATLHDVDLVAAKVDARHVLLVAAPPSDHDSSLWGADRRTGSEHLNRLFRADAARHGWTFADPFAAYRSADNAWRPGSSADGIHPTAGASRVIAGAFGADIERAATTR